MDLMKQMRVRFSGIGEEEEEKAGGSSSSTRDRRIPPQKAHPYKETKRSSSWLERQFTRKMSNNFDSNGVDYPAAVAAAAYAVKSIEDKSNREQGRANNGANKPSNKIKSKVTDDIAKKPEKFSDASKSSSIHPDKNVPTRKAAVNPEPDFSVPSIKKTPTFGNTKPDSGVAEKAKGAASVMRKASTFADKNTDITAPKTPEVPMYKPAVTPTRQSSSQPVMAKDPNMINSGTGNYKADTWEKQEMEKIRERYEKLTEQIEKWETKKKTKAKRDLERTEAELDRRRAKAMKYFQSEIGRIESIAGGAKAQAEQNRNNEEIKVKEKAKKMSSTGKMPATCLCF